MPKEINKLKLPAKYPGPPDKLKGYLHEKRGISDDTIELLLSMGIIYQDYPHNNIVFSSSACWAEIRGTNEAADKRCKHRKSCANYKSGKHQWCECKCDKYKKDSFHISCSVKKDDFWYFKPNAAASDTIYICESSIDAISLYELKRMHKTRESAVYISIGGAGKQAAIDRIVRHCDSRKVILAVDNDNAGDVCRNRNPNLDYITPSRKDWNEDLIALLAELQQH